MGTPIITLYQDTSHRCQVIAFWKAVFGYGAKHNRPSLIIDKKREVDDLFFVAVDGKMIVGTIMCGYDGHRGWIYSLAVAPSHRRQGVGFRLVSHAEHVGVSHDMVRRYRNEMESTGILCQSGTRTGQDGRTINTSNIGNKPPDDNEEPYEPQRVCNECD